MLVEAGDAIVEWLNEHDIDTSVTAKIKPNDLDTPPNAIVEFSNTESEAPSRWLLAECWWANEFDPPPPTGVLVWAFRVLPMTLIGHFTKIQEASFTEKLLNPLIITIKVLASLLIAPLIAAVLAVILILGILPFEFTNKLASSMQRILAGIVGDSYVLLASPVRRAAILSKVARDLDWVSQRSSRVVVVAHSQGAAIAHQFLASHSAPKVDTLVTYGSGLQKLSSIEARENPKLTGTNMSMTPLFTGLLVTLGLIGFLTLSQGVIRALEISGAAVLFSVSMSNIAIVTLFYMKQNLDMIVANKQEFYGFLIGSFVLMLFGGALIYDNLEEGVYLSTTIVLISVTISMFFLMEVTHRLSLQSVTASVSDPRTFAKLPMAWHDLYASHDPVSNGKMNFHTPTSSQEVANFGSTTFDHTGYWKNRDQFVGWLLHHVSKTQLGSESELLNTDGARENRVKVLRYVKGILFTVFAALAIGTIQIDPEYLSDKLSFDTNIGLIDWLTGYPYLTCLGLILCAGVMASVLAQNIWRVWDRQAMMRISETKGKILFGATSALMVISLIYMAAVIAQDMA